MLAVEDVTCRYGRALAVDGVSLEVAAGEVVALLGPNGAGKSTLLRAVSGLMRPASGGITLDGVSLLGMSPPRIVRAGVGHVPQGRRLFPAETAEDNLRIGAHTRRTALDAQVEAMFARAPMLAAHRHRRAGLLSGGQQQLLAILRALMSRPRFLLLDEPFNGLSPAARAIVVDLVAQLRDEGIGVLLVEQLAGPALGVASRAYVLRGGSVVVAGAAADLAGDQVVYHAYTGR
jgi:branched-chain amino acid transport system ATP-binding protein